MTSLRRLSARQLTLAALGLWLCSLPLTGLALYGERQPLSGLLILVTGWMSPLALNFAWFANVFFLSGIVRLLKGGLPITAALLAALLSLDTFRFSVSMLDEGGGSAPVYGYGWGCVLWFVSIAVLVMATGWRQLESRPAEAPAGAGELLTGGGFLFGLLTLVTASWFAATDRVDANPGEAQRLRSIAFKRGKVCSVPDPVVARPLPAASGPLEVVVEKGALYASHPFSQVRELLAWGIPVVRMDGADYSLAGDLLTSVAAEGPPGAVLTVTESAAHAIRARLQEGASRRLVFDRTWVREDTPLNFHYYCPDYTHSPSEPRQLLQRALGLGGGAGTPGTAAPPPETTPQWNGRIVERRAGGETTARKLLRWQETHPGGKSGMPSHEWSNTGCPADVGWDGSKPPSAANAGRPFRIGERAYYPPWLEQYKATCAGDAVYLHASSFGNGRYSLLIEKRGLPEFRRLWFANLTIPDEKGEDRPLKLASVGETPTGLRLELVNDFSGEILIVETTR